MQNNCPASALPILRLPPRRNYLRQSLNCQHWRHETTTTQTLRRRQGSKSSESWRLSKGLEESRGSVPVLRAPICPKDHLLQSDKLSSRWSSCGAFWHWQDKKVGWPEILLAEPEEERRELGQRIRRLSDFKNCPPQALCRSTVLTCTNSLMERPFDRLCDRFTAFFWLERQQLQLNSCHSRPLDQYGALWASQGHHRRSETSESNYKRRCTVLRLPRLHHK